MSAPGLRRVLGLPAVTFIAVGFMIGGGVFVFSGIALDVAGPALPLCYALAVIPVALATLPLAALGAALPATGANYRYPSRMVSPGLAFTGIWVYALASFFGQIPLYALGCARYAASLAPGLPEVPLALLLVTLFCAVNLLGVRLAAVVQGVCVLVLLSALGFYVVRGGMMFEPDHVTPLLVAGPGGVLLGTALLTFTYFGANGVVELGGEIREPGRVIPRAFAIAFPVVALIYVAVALVTVGAAPTEALVEADEPLVGVARVTCGDAGLAFFVLGGAVLALTTTLNALYIVGTKSLLIVIQDGLLPAWLGWLHPRFRTPWVLLGLIWVLSVAGILSGLSLETLASYAALGGLIIFLPIQIAAVRLPRLYPERVAAASFRLRGVALWTCAGVGVVMVLFFGLVILVDLGSLAKVAGFLGFVVTGVGFYLVRRRQLEARGVDLGTLREREGWDDDRKPDPDDTQSG